MIGEKGDRKYGNIKGGYTVDDRHDQMAGQNKFVRDFISKVREPCPQHNISMLGEPNLTHKPKT